MYTGEGAKADGGGLYAQSMSCISGDRMSKSIKSARSRQEDVSISYASRIARNSRMRKVARTSRLIVVLLDDVAVDGAADVWLVVDGEWSCEEWPLEAEGEDGTAGKGSDVGAVVS